MNVRIQKDRTASLIIDRSRKAFCIVQFDSPVQMLFHSVQSTARAAMTKLPKSQVFSKFPGRIRVGGKLPEIPFCRSYASNLR